jgi:hypothetical protein
MLSTIKNVDSINLIKRTERVPTKSTKRPLAANTMATRGLLLALFSLAIRWNFPTCRAFAPLPPIPLAPSIPHEHVATTTRRSTFSLSETATSQEPDPLDEMSDERKATLFQFLLRDLEVEEVPLLGVDATDTHVFQAALWTTMAELSESDVEGRVCLVFEFIPVPTLRAFVEEFDSLKNDSVMMDSLPELQRFNVTLVGRGVGPAMVLSTSNRTDDQQDAYREMKQSAPVPDEIRWNAAMKTFLARTSSSNFDKASYRIIQSADACDILSGYWTSICELLAAPEDQMSSLILTYPPDVQGSENQQRHRYNAIAELMNRMLLLYSDNKDIVSNVHFQPFYDRDATSLVADIGPAHGHLPPTTSVRSESSEEKLMLENYQRRSPLPGVILQRASRDNQYEASKTLSSQTEDELKEALKKEAEIIELSAPKLQ